MNKSLPLIDYGASDHKYGYEGIYISDWGCCSSAWIRADKMGKRETRLSSNYLEAVCLPPLFKHMYDEINTLARIFKVRVNWFRGFK